VQPEQKATGPHLAARMPHAEIWELFCEARESLDDYSKSGQCIPKAVSISDRVQQIVAEGAATLASAAEQKQKASAAPVPLESESELAALYKHMKTASPPDLVAPLSSDLSVFEKRVFPSAAQPDNTFQGWGTLISADDLHVRLLAFSADTCICFLLLFKR
jgi:hypothetical protein